MDAVPILSSNSLSLSGMKLFIIVPIFNSARLEPFLYYCKFKKDTEISYK